MDLQLEAIQVLTDPQLEAIQAPRDLQLEEIQALRAQRQEIDKQIRALQSGVKHVGRVKIARHTYPNVRPLGWFIAVKCRGKWKSIINDDSRDECVRQLDEVIRDLTALKEQEEERLETIENNQP